MLIKLYIYRKSDGVFLYDDVGDPDSVIDSLNDDKDFTLTPPPDSLKQWRWVDNHWE